MQYRVLLSLLAITSFVAAAPAADLKEANTEVAFEAEQYANATEIERRDGEEQNAYCNRAYVGIVDQVTVYGGCNAQGRGLDGNNLAKNTRDQFAGCGALTNEQFVSYGPDGRSDEVQDTSNGKWKGTNFKPCWYYTFVLPSRKKHNCVGRAVKSAGGPAMKCQS